jgi:ethanolamine utilization protein EutN
MMLGQVVGTVVSTVQHETYNATKQLVVRAILPDGTFDRERYVIAVDRVGAGVGERVLVLDEGNSARQLLELPRHGAVRSVIVGIVDAIEVG